MLLRKAILLVVVGMADCPRRQRLWSLGHWQLGLPHFRNVLWWHLQCIPGIAIICVEALRGPQRLLSVGTLPLLVMLSRHVVAVLVLRHENKVDLQIGVCHHTVHLMLADAEVQVVSKGRVEAERWINVEAELVIRF